MRRADGGIDGTVMNPAGFSYAGYALKDCLKGVGVPYVEVHISHLAKRQIQCVLSDASMGSSSVLVCMAISSALRAMLHLLAGRRTNAG